MDVIRHIHAGRDGEVGERDVTSSTQVFIDQDFDLAFADWVNIAGCLVWVNESLRLSQSDVYRHELNCGEYAQQQYLDCFPLERGIRTTSVSSSRLLFAFVIQLSASKSNTPLKL